MLINPDSTTNNSSAILPVATACSNCGVEERRLIHHVRHRGVFRRLCTTCVLRLHPQSFCPTCFQVYPPPPSNDAVVTCFKCYSSSHARCVAAGPTSPPNPYTCPLCLHPNTPIFKLRSRKEANSKIEEFRAMDRDSAKKLLAAAKIASVSMNKAAVAAKAEAERRAKDAAYARKRAKEALDHVSYLLTKEKPKKRGEALVRPGDVTGPRSSGMGTNGGYSVPAVKTDRESNVNASASASASTSSNNRNGNVALLKNAGNVDRDNSSRVLAALNAVELRENEKLGGENTDLMDVDEKEGRLDSSSDHVNLSDKQAGAETLNTQEEEEEIVDVDSEVILVHYNENSNGGEQPSNLGSL